MFKRVILNTASKKNYVVLSGKIKHIQNNNLRFKVCIAPSLNSHFMQARFCSSNITGSASHKALFSNEETYQPIEEISTASTASSSSSSVEYIPPPPLPPDIPDDPLPVLNKLGEETFESLGLGGYSPVGLFQSLLEFVHVSTGLPWWGSIVIVTATVRLCLFPLMIMSQRKGAKMSNQMPAIQRMQAKITNARLSGDEYEMMKCQYELQKFMKEKGVGGIDTLLSPMIQAPVVISMIMSLRSCSTLPVESMKTGGMYWFTDLTAPDPYLILPLATTVTTFATLKVALSENSAMQLRSSPLMKYGINAIPLLVFPFIMNMPSSILCYFVTTTLFSLLQTAFLKVPRVRDYYGIERIMKPPSSEAQDNKKGFMATAKESWANMKLMEEISQRKKMDEMRFKRAGTDPLIKTYETNPLAKKVIDVKGQLKK